MLRRRSSKSISFLLSSACWYRAADSGVRVKPVSSAEPSAIWASMPLRADSPALCRETAVRNCLTVQASSRAAMVSPAHSSAWPWSARDSSIPDWANSR